MVRVKSDPTERLFHQQLPTAAAAIELVPTDYFAPLDLGKIFSRLAPLELDLGCGDGSFLVAMASGSAAASAARAAARLATPSTMCAFCG